MTQLNDLLFDTQLNSDFCGLFQLGKLVLPDNKKMRGWKKITMHHTLEWLPHVYTFWLPCHKSDAIFKGNHILCRQIRGGPDPLPVMHQYIIMCDCLFPLLVARGQFNTCSFAVDGQIPCFLSQSQTFQAVHVGCWCNSPSRSGCHTRLDYGIQVMELTSLDVLCLKEPHAITCSHSCEIKPFWWRPHSCYERTFFIFLTYLLP